MSPRAGVSKGAQHPFGQGWGECPTCEGETCDMLFVAVEFTSPADQWRKRALEAEREIGIVHLVTTEAVLVEVLNHFGSFRHDIKTAAARVVRRMLGDEMEVEVVPTTSDAFLHALAFYESRSDKGYSLTDCLSMNVMRERQIKEVLTHDRHFAQEGFNVLL